MHHEKLPTLGKSKEELLLNHGQNLLNNIEDRLTDIMVLEARLQKQGLKINLNDYEALAKTIGENGEYKILIQEVETALHDAQKDPQAHLEVLKKFDENGEYHRKLKNIEKELLTVIHNYPFNQIDIGIDELKR